VLRDLKRYTVTAILKEIAQNSKESGRDWMLKRFAFAAKRPQRNSAHQFWTHENHAVELITNKFIRQKCSYRHRNPVRAGWVNDASDWKYSSASNGEKTCLATNKK
jgi:REP element-mobilizing transposase RayT